MAITTQDIADHINTTYQSTLSADEIAVLDGILTPESAEVLIKLVGDVSFLIHVRDNGSND
jgi:ribosomal protein L9